jgi:hypothetical protein
MRKFVIFNYCGTLAFTTLDNYNRRIMDRGQIALCKNYSGPDEIIEYFSQYCGLSKNDFIVKI